MTDQITATTADGTDVVYVLRHTDGYDANTVVLATTVESRVIAYIEKDPPDRLDYYVIEKWVDGEEVETTTFGPEDWHEPDQD